MESFMLYRVFQQVWSKLKVILKLRNVYKVFKKICIVAQKNCGLSNFLFAEINKCVL